MLSIVQQQPSRNKHLYTLRSRLKKTRRSKASSCYATGPKDGRRAEPIPPCSAPPSILV